MLCPQVEKPWPHLLVLQHLALLKGGQVLPVALERLRGRYGPRLHCCGRCALCRACVRCLTAGGCKGGPAGVGRPVLGHVRQAAGAACWPGRRGGVPATEAALVAAHVELGYLRLSQDVVGDQPVWAGEVYARPRALLQLGVEQLLLLLGGRGWQFPC